MPPSNVDILKRKDRIRTLGDLHDSGYRGVSVKEEMRLNMIEKLKKHTPIFQNILGFDQTVIPQVENAILAGHDMILLGERGQAKTRLVRSLVDFLDEFIPVIKGCEINDNPFAPICKECQLKVIELGNRVEIAWLHRSSRYAEKLATPDVTIADLIGEIDPVKLAEGRYLSDERVIHYGLIPRVHRGLFAMNELPDLSEKVQVGLFNIMEERDIQIKGFPVRLPLDVYIVATANPEDYTSRGRIITPLKDRYRAQIRTHYPMTPEVEQRVIEQERRPIETSLDLSVPPFMKEIVVELTFLARESCEINQRSGVSVRMSISNYESLISNAEKRALRLNEPEIVPRISDLQALIATTTGKIELEYLGEDKREEEVIQSLILKAVRSVFDRHFKVEEFSSLLDLFDQGGCVEISSEMPAQDYLDLLNAVPDLEKAFVALDSHRTPGLQASAIEFILEGLHLNGKLSKQSVDHKAQYRS